MSFRIFHVCRNYRLTHYFLVDCKELIILSLQAFIEEQNLVVQFHGDGASVSRVDRSYGTVDVSLYDLETLEVYIGMSFVVTIFGFLVYPFP